MHHTRSRGRRHLCLAVLLMLGAGVGSAGAQTKAIVPADTTPPQPAAAQPVLPGAAKASPPKPGSPVVEEIVRNRQTPLEVRKKAARPPRLRVRRVVHYYHLRRDYGPSIERPALAGVELVAPLPPAIEPPHIVVPTPAYPLEAIVAGITTPPPPIVCHHAPRIPYAPDPRLYREQPVACEPDTP